VSRRVRDERIIGVICSLRAGEVVSYGDVAADAGYPGCARLVGRLLAAAGAGDVPWWRVVAASGRLVPGLEIEQAALLEREGAVVRRGRVCWAPVGRFNRSAR
jgi:methylated-DNA-protein-cysteine methyltransferase-like protein